MKTRQITEWLYKYLQMSSDDRSLALRDKPCRGVANIKKHSLTNGMSRRAKLLLIAPISEGLGVVEVEDAGAEDALVFGLYGLGL